MKTNSRKLKVLLATSLCTVGMVHLSTVNSQAAVNASDIQLIETGDNTASAQEIFAHTSYTGEIDHASDIDYYSFVAQSEGSNGCFYTFHLGNDNVPSRAVYTLYNSSMETVSSFPATAVGTGIENAKTVALSAGERYILTVSSGSSTVTSGSYNFNIETTLDDITDTIAASTKVELEKSASGTIQCVDDKDIFKVNPGSFKSMSVTISNTSDYSSTIVCKILNANGAVLSQGGCTDGDSFTLSLTNIKANTDYFVQITGPEGSTYTVTPTNLKKTVTYCMFGGKNPSKNPKSYTCGIGSKLYDPTKKGYEFKGWYKDATFNNEVTEISKSETDDLILYAKWEKMCAGKVGKIKKSKVTSNSITITWNKVSKASGYEIYRGNKKVGDTNKRKYTFRNLTASKEYVIKVRAYREYSTGTAYGKYQKVTICTRPKTPEITYAKGETINFFKGQISIAWSTQNNVDGYQIYTSHMKKYGYIKKSTVDSSASAYTIKNLFKKGYWVKVRAYKETDNGVVYSEFSTPVKVTAKTLD